MRYIETSYKIMGKWITQDTYPKNDETAEEVAFGIWEKLRFNNTQNATQIYIIDLEANTKVLFDPIISLSSQDDELF